MKTVVTTILFMSLIIFTGCGGGGDSEAGKQSRESQQAEKTNGLTAFEIEHGIGPITEEVKLGELNTEIAEQGEQIFREKCSACHKPTERYIGPAPQGVLDRRTPTYVMNMIMNPDEMTKKHPEAKKLLQEYMSPMPFQNVTEEQARAIVEYFRTIEEEAEEEAEE